jgi:hypothetical protein
MRCEVRSRLEGIGTGVCCLAVVTLLAAASCERPGPQVSLPTSDGSETDEAVIEQALQRVVLLMTQADGFEDDPELEGRREFLIKRGVQRGRLPAGPPTETITFGSGGGGRPTVLEEVVVTRDDDSEYHQKRYEYCQRIRQKEARVALHQFLTRYGRDSAPVVARAFVRQALVEAVEPEYYIEIVRAYGDCIADPLLREYEKNGGQALVYERILRHAATSWSFERQLQEYAKAVDDRRRGGPSYTWRDKQVRERAVELAGDLLQRDWGLDSDEVKLEADISEFKEWYRQHTAR